MAERKYSKSADILFVKESSKEKFHMFKKFLREKKNDPDWLEALASIHFLKHVYPDLPKKKVVLVVCNKQPHLTIEECLSAWDYLEKFKLLD